LKGYPLLPEKWTFSLQRQKGTSQLAKRVRKLIQKSKSGKPVVALFVETVACLTPISKGLRAETSASTTKVKLEIVLFW